MENLPQQICDLCIVQLNVSYNFKRLALKNDFYMRNYLIENGISLQKDEMETTTTTTALEIHQIQHNVIRTNRFRPAITEIPQNRRNSTTSSISGASTLMILNGRENESTNNFATPSNSSMRPPMIRPIQIKSEPVDPDESTSNSSSPTVSNTGQDSIVTVNSSNISKEKSQTPMVVISGEFVKEISSPPVERPAPLSVKLGRNKQNTTKIISKEATKQQPKPKKVIGKDGFSPNGVKLGRPRTANYEYNLKKTLKKMQKKKELAALNDKKLVQTVKKNVILEKTRISPRKRQESSRISKRKNDKAKKIDEQNKKKTTTKKTQKTQNKKVKK
jgi:hypothetical protein